MSQQWRGKKKKKKVFFYLVGVWKENTGLAVTNNNDDDSGVLKSLFSKEPLARTLHTEVKKKKKKNNDYSKSVTFLCFCFLQVQICRTSFRLDTIQPTIVHHPYTTLAVISLIQ